MKCSILSTTHSSFRSHPRVQCAASTDRTGPRHDRLAANSRQKGTYCSHAKSISRIYIQHIHFTHSYHLTTTRSRPIAVGKVHIVKGGVESYDALSLQVIFCKRALYLVALLRLSHHDTLAANMGWLLFIGSLKL